MKKFIVVLMMLGMFCLAENCFADWTYKIIKVTEKSEDTLWADVVYTDGIKTIEVRVPSFQPKSTNDVHTAIKNRFVSEKRKIDAEAEIDVLKPNVDKDVNKPFPTTVAG